MGIRMQLAVGYGLDLSQLPELDRERLDWDILESKDLFNQWKEETLAFAKANDELMEKMIFHEKMSPPKSLDEMIQYQAEFGDPDRILIVPADQHKSWKRYGNLLDAFLYEAQQDDLEFGMEPEWLPHPGTLYPYIGLMKENLKKPLGIEKYWVSCYRNHPEHKDAIAWAPWHIFFLLKAVFQLSEEECRKVYLSLRPGVYRYFS